jgi:hypothetical protein
VGGGSLKTFTLAPAVVAAACTRPRPRTCARLLQSVQLMCSDYLTTMPFPRLKRCLEVAALYGGQQVCVWGGVGWGVGWGGGETSARDFCVRQICRATQIISPPLLGHRRGFLFDEGQDNTLPFQVALHASMCVQVDMNVSLTTISLLWNAADMFGRSSALPAAPPSIAMQRTSSAALLAAGDGEAAGEAPLAGPAADEGVAGGLGTRSSNQLAVKLTPPQTEELMQMLFTVLQVKHVQLLCSFLVWLLASYDYS